MPSGQNKIDKHLEDQVLTMQYLDYKRYSDFTDIKSYMKRIDSESTKMRSDINKFKSVLIHTMSQKHNYSRYKIDSPKSNDPPTALSANKRAQKL